MMLEMPDGGGVDCGFFSRLSEGPSTLAMGECYGSGIRGRCERGLGGRADKRHSLCASTADGMQTGGRGNGAAELRGCGMETSSRKKRRRRRRGRALVAPLVCVALPRMWQGAGLGYQGRRAGAARPHHHHSHTGYERRVLFELPSHRPRRLTRLPAGPCTPASPRRHPRPLPLPARRHHARRIFDI
jgi:hypothetical protein